MGRRWIGYALAATFVFSTLTAIIISPKIRAAAEERYQDLQLFAKVLNLVQQYYVEEVDTKKLIYGGIKGMLRELDPHTNFLPPSIYKEFETETTGEFGGIGIEITIQNGILTVISPIEDTPAFKAGIKAGDKIVEIDGESTKGFSLVEAAQRMKGKKGAKIKLTIFREGLDAPKEFVIERGTVKIKSVKYQDLDGGYAYIRITSFIENSVSDLEKAIKAHERKYKTVKGMIIDLRRNPGGLLDQAIKISDLFLEQGTIVSTMGRNQKEKEVVFAKKAGTLPNFPTVILIDEYSASASEILAGALQDNKRALVMGHRSFGKGSVQSVVKLGDGSGLKLTVGRYYTPNGRSIQAYGIVPDIELEDFAPEVLDQARVKHDARREGDIRGHLIGDNEEGEAAGPAAAKDSKKNKNPSRQEEPKKVQYWWTETGNKPDKELTPRDRLLKDDYQVQQAYNYLKAWVVIEDQKASAGSSAVSKEAATPVSASASESGSGSDGGGTIQPLPVETVTVPAAPVSVPAPEDVKLSPKAAPKAPSVTSPQGPMPTVKMMPAKKPSKKITPAVGTPANKPAVKKTNP